MRILRIEVQNFRLLEDAKVALDEDTTLIVGRNNSGKTSFSEVFNKFLGSDSCRFSVDDLTIGVFAKFEESLKEYKAYEKAKTDKEDVEEIAKKERDYKDGLPEIVLNVFIEYEEKDDLSSLSKFLMDLDPTRKDVLISCVFKIENPDKFFFTYEKESKSYKNDIKEFVKKNFQKFYREKLYAVDEKDRNNKCEVTKKDIENIFVTQFIHAQSQLDDQSTDNTKGLSKGFEDYFKYNSDNEYIEKIEALLLKLAEELDGNYKSFFDGIFTDLKTFGVDSEVNIQSLLVKSQFEAAKILKGNTKLYYEHGDVLLPEAHNGLGYSKLIFIILSFIGFFEEFSKREPKSELQLLFIEEPEAHLHPQMQQVFIKNIRKFVKEKKGWNIQIVITTHSSHIVAESAFKCIRYFDISDKKLIVKHLSKFQETEEVETINFLKQYMSLNKCDMFFADKIILIEGTVERLLLPEMIKGDADKLQFQYISIIEVGGAYAHLFQKLLEFLNVKSLVITDIDCIDSSAKRSACKVQEGANFLTCNETLKTWLPQKEKISDLLKVTEQEKVMGKIRIAYQIPEAGSTHCGRSFEEAFILKNAQLFIENKEKFRSLSGKLDSYADSKAIQDNSYEIAANISKKTDFAFDVMLLEGWKAPKYINDALVWLQQK